MRCRSRHHHARSFIALVYINGEGAWTSGFETLYKENRKEMHVRRVGSCGVRREFRSEACALGCDESRARFPLPHWNVAPFASSSLYWASTLRYLSPCRRQVASRERIQRTEGYAENSRNTGNRGRITVNCYFCKQNDFILPMQENTG